MGEDGGAGGCGGDCGVGSEEKQRHTMLRHIKFSICGDVCPMTVETILSRGQPTGFFVDPVTGADQKDINWFVYGNSGACYSPDAVDPMGNPTSSCAYSQRVEQKCPNPEDAWNDGSLSRMEQKQYNSIADFTFDSCPPIDPFDLAFQRDRPFGPRSPARPARDVPPADSKLPKEMRFSDPPPPPLCLVEARGAQGPRPSISVAPKR